MSKSKVIIPLYFVPRGERIGGFSLPLGTKAPEGGVLVHEGNLEALCEEHAMDEEGHITIWLMDTVQEARAAMNAIDAFEGRTSTFTGRLPSGEGILLGVNPDLDFGFTIQDKRTPRYRYQEDDIYGSWEMSEAETNTFVTSLNDEGRKRWVESMVASINEACDDVDLLKQLQRAIEGIPGASVAFIGADVDGAIDTVMEMEGLEDVDDAVREVAHRGIVAASHQYQDSRALESVLDAAEDAVLGAIEAASPPTP